MRKKKGREKNRNSPRAFPPGNIARKMGLTVEKKGGLRLEKATQKIRRRRKMSSSTSTHRDAEKSGEGAGETEYQRKRETRIGEGEQGFRGGNL